MAHVSRGEGWLVVSVEPERGVVVISMCDDEGVIEVATCDHMIVRKSSEC